MRLDPNKLVQLRMKRRWTQKEAAERAGVSLPTYNRAEQGLNMQPLKAAMIVSAFKATVDDLAQRNGEEVA